MITKNPASRTLIIHPLGDLDALKAEHYRRQLRALIDEGYHFLIFDLQDTAFINSCGLGLLVEFYNTVSRLDGTLKLIHCNPQAFELLRQTHLDKIFFSDGGAEDSLEQIPSVQFDPLHALMSDEILLLTQLRQTTEEILRLDEPAAIGEVILCSAMETLRARRSAFFAVCDNEQHLRLTHWKGCTEDEPAPEIGTITLRPERAEYQLLQHDQVTWTARQDGDEGHNGLFERLGFTEALAAPICGRERKYGLLILEPGDETGRILQFAKPLVRTLTNLCGLALEKAVLLGELNNKNGELSSMVGRAHDFYQSLRHAGRLAALSVVVTGLGHQLNNKLVPLMGYSQMLVQKRDLPPGMSEKIKRIYEASEEVNQTVNRLLNISRQHDVVKQPIKLEELLHATVDLLSEQIRTNRIAVHLHIAPTPAGLLGNPELLLQALLSVLHRACTSFVEDSHENWLRLVSTVNEKNMRLIVEDNGSRFDEYDQMDCLDPIVPEEAMTNGRLFNYTIPRSILRRHNGNLTLEPRSEGGKRVIIDLQLA